MNEDFINNLTDAVQERRLFIAAQERKYGQFLTRTGLAIYHVMNGVAMLSKLASPHFAANRLQKLVEENFDDLVVNLAEAAQIDYNILIQVMKEHMEFTDKLSARLSPDETNLANVLKTVEETIAKARK